MIVLELKEGEKDEQGDLHVLLSNNDRMIIRSLIQYFMFQVSEGRIDIDKEDLLDIVEFNNRFAEETSAKN